MTGWRLLSRSSLSLVAISALAYGDSGLLDDAIRRAEQVDTAATRLSFVATQHKRSLVRIPVEAPRGGSGQAGGLVLGEPLWRETEVRIVAWRDGYSNRRLDVTTLYEKYEGEEEPRQKPFETVTFTGEKSMLWFPEGRSASIHARDMVYALHGPLTYGLIQLGGGRGLGTIHQVLNALSEGTVAGKLEPDPGNPDQAILFVGDVAKGDYSKAILDKRYGYQVARREEYRGGRLRFSEESEYAEVDSVPLPKSGTAKWFNRSGEVTGIHTLEVSQVRLNPPELRPELFWPELPAGTTVTDNIIDTWYVVGGDDLEEFRGMKELLVTEKLELDQERAKREESVSGKVSAGAGEGEAGDDGQASDQSGRWHGNWAFVALFVLLFGGLTFVLSRVLRRRQA